MILLVFLLISFSLASTQKQCTSSSQWWYEVPLSNIARLSNEFLNYPLSYVAHGDALHNITTCPNYKMPLLSGGGNTCDVLGIINVYDALHVLWRIYWARGQYPPPLYLDVLFASNYTLLRTHGCVFEACRSVSNVKGLIRTVDCRKATAMLQCIPRFWWSLGVLCVVVFSVGFMVLLLIISCIVVSATTTTPPP